MPYTPYYAGGWQNSPSTSTPIVAAALANIETGLTALAGPVTLVAAPTGTASTDTANISTAITAWTSGGRGILQFQPGTYVTNGGHLVGGGSPGAGVIQGAGWNTQVKLANGANSWIFDFGSAGSPQYTPGICIRNMYLNCNGGNQTGASGGIYARGSVFGVFDHLWIDTPYTAGIWFYYDGLSNYGHHNRITHSLFTNGYVSGSYGLGIRFDHADENSIDACTFQDNGTSTYPSTQVYDTSGGRNSITNSAFVTTRATAVSMFKTDSSPSACMLSANAFDSNTTGNLLEINGPDCVIASNNFLSFGNTANAAVHLNGATSTAYGNTFTPQGSSGTAILNDAAGCKVGANNYIGSYANNAPVVYSAVTVPPLNPVDWGADPTGTADATAIVAAVIAALSSAGGGLMDCPPATFKMSSPVSITSANVRIRGAGAHLTIFKMTASFGTSGTGRGIFQYLSGPASFTGCEITDCGFDTTACTDTTVNAANAIYQNGSVPMADCKFQRLYFTMNSYGQGILLNQLGGSGGASYGLTFRDMWALNGAGTVSLYNNGVTAGSLVSGVMIDNIWNRVTGTSLNDDRVCISGNNGGGTNVVEMRNIAISNVYTEIAAGSTGAVNGVKLDCGAYGYIHEVSVTNTFYRGIAGITYNNPVLCNLGTNGTMQDITIDGVWGYNCGSVLARMGQSDACPYIYIRNVHLYNLLDTRAIEVYTSSTASGDETVIVENCYLHSGTSVSGNTPVGVMLTSGTSGQGASGLVSLSGIILAGTFSTGLSSNLNESGSSQASGYANIQVAGCNLTAATTAQSLTGTGSVPDAEQFTCLSGSYTLANSTSAQPLFNATTNGALAVAAATTYFFECEFDITGLSSSSHTFQFGFGGTATVTSVKYLADVLSPFTAGTFASWPTTIFTSASAQTFVPAGTNTSVAARIRGEIRINAGGTLIPQVTQGTASAAAVVAANSYIRLIPVGSNTVTNTGPWS